MRRHRQRHGRAQHRLRLDRPHFLDPERGGHDWNAEWMHLLHSPVRPCHPDHSAHPEAKVQLHCD